MPTRLSCSLNHSAPRARVLSSNCPKKTYRGPASPGDIRPSMMASEMSKNTYKIRPQAIAACRPTKITFIHTNDRYRLNDSLLSRLNSSRCRSFAPRLCTARILTNPSSAVAVELAPALRLASDLRRVAPVIKSEDISSMGTASQANSISDGTDA